ncbi:hypothetical protein ACFL27_12340, partial [candidate division CSSED10-310 bacterium]
QEHDKCSSCRRAKYELQKKYGSYLTGVEEKLKGQPLRLTKTEKCKMTCNYIITNHSEDPYFIDEVRRAQDILKILAKHQK